MSPSHTIHYRDIDRYCDSLERVGNVNIILKANRINGYALWIENVGDIRKVVDDRGNQVWFRTVDQALEELINISYLSNQITVDKTNW
ncbi:hypothetical protein SAMN04490369_107414 [Vreelandella aquamarina]|uniref:Uncharacterized protein n=1 Tax=Vreelandella aquamarina TaxID=77097 RepID=A0A1H8NZC9_9GAMM|nr:hypothetical protein SAMN04490369_107414 [Halomonas aquamarina]